jgi:hypothetical protein
MKKRIAASAAAAAIGLGGSLIAAAPAQAAPLVTGGLVNVTIVDVIDDVTVEITDVNVGVAAALQLAANVCGTTVALVAQDIATDGTCTNEVTGDSVIIEQR